MTIWLNKLASRAWNTGTPAAMVIELNRSCNLRCRHCYHGTFDGCRLSLSELAGLWPQLRDMGVLQLTFTGGEIFCHPDIRAILEAARDNYFMVNLLTNLTLLTPDLASFLKNIGISLVRTSLYFPTAGEHDDFVGRSGAFAATLAGLDMLHDQGIATRIQMTLMEQNIGQVEAMEKLAAAHNSSCFGVFYIDPANNGGTAPQSYIPTRDTLRRAVAVQGNSRLLSAWMARRECGPEGCGAASYSGFIDAEFNLWPCLSWPCPAGKITGDNFKSLWWGPVMTAARQTIKEANHCVDCPHRRYCSPCVALNLRENGRAEKPFSWRCRQASDYAAVWNPNGA